MSHLPNKYHAFLCTQSRPAGHPRGCCTTRGGGAEYFNRLMALMTEKKVWDLGNVSVAQSSCLGFCKFGPMMVVYPQGVWYKLEKAEDIDEIVDSHFLNDTPVERLIVTPTKG